MKERALILYLAALLLLYAAYVMLLPLLPAIFWAIVLSISFYPLYRFILLRIRNADISALVIVLISFLLVVGPLSYLSYILVFEIKNAVQQLSGRGGPASLFENRSIAAVTERTARLLNISTADIYETAYSVAGSLKKSLLLIIRENAFLITHAIVDYFIMLFTIFFLLRDNRYFVERFYAFLPLSEDQKTRLVERIHEVIISTVYGGITIALAHGIVGGVAFSLLGVPSPVLLGFAMAVFSFVPVFGAFLIWGPVTAYLFLSGSVLKGIVMAAVGVLGIAGAIDHILKPKIIGRRARIHTLVIFFAVLGGIHLFGVIGFIAGPLVLAVLILVLEIIGRRPAEA